MPRGSLAAVTDEPQSAFASKKITIGDTEYTVHELSGKDYDECVELARIEPTPQWPGGIDGHIQLLFMAERAVEPKMKMSQINELPFTKRALLYDTVNEVHGYTPPKSPDETEKSEGA